MTQRGLEENLQNGIQGMLRGQLEGGMLLDRLVRTSRCPLALDLRGKAHSDKAQVELQGRRQMVLLGKGRVLQVAALELLQVGTAQETDPGLQDWRGTALELLVQDIVQVSRVQVGTHQGLKEALDIGLVLQDQREMGTALVPPVQMIHQSSQREQRAGWGLLVLTQAILGLRRVGGYGQRQTGWCGLFSLPGLGYRLLKHLPATDKEKEKVSTHNKEKLV